jgi:hypothetical protein
MVNIQSWLYASTYNVDHMEIFTKIWILNFKVIIHYLYHQPPHLISNKSFNDFLI